MSRFRPASLRTRLMLAVLAGSIMVVAALLVGFNLVLDARLRGDADSLLRQRAAAQLQALPIAHGRLRTPEAPDNATPDTQTWLFVGGRTLERPAVDARDQRAAVALAAQAPRRRTVQQTDTRLFAVPIVSDSRRLGTLVVGASLTPYESSAHTALIASLILGALTALAIAAASWWLIGRALSPVARMTAKAAEWGEHDISGRFYAGTPHDELTRLAATFDALLERLAQSLQREQRLTAEISHELRTPLAKVLAEAELASDPDRPRSTTEYRRAAAAIRTAAEQLSKSLDMVLAAARAEHAGTPSTIDARAVAERAADSQRAAALRNGITIEVTGSAAPTRVGVEPDLLERALVPILDNAVRHARRRVAISVRDHDRQLVFEINDDGPGIDPAIQGQIFEPGFGAANGAASGAGLGLPLARRLARAARGEVECHNQPTGARFTARFPLA